MIGWMLQHTDAMKLRCTLILILPCLFLCGGCRPSGAIDDSTDESGLFPQIGLSLLTLDNPYFRQVAGSMKAEGRRLGYAVTVCDGGFDNELQQAQIRQFIRDHAEAIVVSPCDSMAVGPALQEAAAAGIPVFTVDTACLVPDAPVVTHVATDNYGGGKQAAYAMIKALGKRGGQVAIVDYKKIESSVLRVKGFKEIIDRHNAGRTQGRIDLVAELSGGAAADGGFQAGTAMIRQYPGLGGVFAINDPSALGVRAALEKAERSEVAVVGFDGSLKGRRAVKQGRLVATPLQYPDQVGLETVRAVVRHLRGEALPSEMLIPTSLYRKADADRDPDMGRSVL